jgi:hypothetical protein
MSVPPAADWILTSQQLPARETPEAEHSEVVDIVVVIGFSERYITQARYSYSKECWESQLDHFGLSAWGWVTHWKKVAELPEPVSQEAIMAYVTSLEPDYDEAKPNLRALFADVDKDDKKLQNELFEAIAHTGLQGTPVQGRGVMKDNKYYIDFWVSEALHLRQVKRALAGAPVAYTIRPRETK